MTSAVAKRRESPVPNVRPVRVAHVVSHPIQYFAPLYRELALRRELDLTVYFCSTGSMSTFFDVGFQREISWDADLVGGYKSVAVPSAERRGVGQRRWTSVHADLLRTLFRGGEFDVVWIHGYASLVNWLVVLLAAVRGIPVLLRDDQVLMRNRRTWRRWVKEFPLRLLMKLCYGLAVGTATQEYFERYGMRSDRIHVVPYAADPSQLSDQVGRLRPVARAIRAEFDLTDDPVALFAGRLIWQKQPLLLLEAFVSARRRCRAQLLVVGDGPMRGLMEEVVQGIGIDCVHFAGFLGQQDIAKAYAIADFLVLPSVSETWGLVVNEAMSVGVPAIVSDRVGCCDDLVRPGPCGVVVPYDDSRALSEAIARVASDADLRAVLSARSLERIAEFSVAASADGVVAAARAAVRAHRNEAS